MNFSNMSEQNCTNPIIQSPLNRASKDKFVLVLNLPPVLRKIASNDPLLNVDNIQISVFGSVVPNINVAEVDVRYGGQNLHLSTYARPPYPPLMVNFIVDNDYQNYYLLWKWLEIANDPRLSIYKGSKDYSLESGNSFEYQTDFSILALNEYNEIVMEFIYYKAFVTTLGSINYSYRDGEVIECSAEFHYSQLDIKKHFAKNLPNTEI